MYGLGIGTNCQAFGGQCDAIVYIGIFRIFVYIGDIFRIFVAFGNARYIWSSFGHCGCLTSDQATNANQLSLTNPANPAEQICQPIPHKIRLLRNFLKPHKPGIIGLGPEIIFKIAFCFFFFKMAFCFSVCLCLYSRWYLVSLRLSALTSKTMGCAVVCDMSLLREGE